MSGHSNDDTSNEVQWAELLKSTRSKWVQLPRRERERILKLDFVKRLDGYQIFFNEPYPQSEIAPILEKHLLNILGTTEIEISYFATAALTDRRNAERLESLIKVPSNFRNISFGSDVAERDQYLLNYFITTRAYESANSGKASVIIGPKGSGKTAILRAIQSNRGERNTIAITPEVFATSMLRQVIQNQEGTWDEDQAFISTWIFSIMVEVFKRFSSNPRGVPASTLKKLRAFLADNTDFEDLDLFTRFVGYLRKIEGIKIGNYELTVKTRLLQELYSLTSIYEIVPGLRGADGEIFILLDELDQGWDNTPHANQFVASLLKAAIKIQSLGLKAHVIAFLRSEIFDLIKDHLDQLDKLRTSIEIIKWSDGELASLLVRRLAYSLSSPYKKTDYDIEILNAFFDRSIHGMRGFIYIISRTTLRPREVLQFFAHAHRLAVEAGYTSIGPEILAKAEEDFSSWKFEHVCSEYTHIYPGLKDLLWMFRAEGPVLSDLDAQKIINRYISQLPETPPWANASPINLLQLLYDIEFLGLPRPIPARNRQGIVSQYEFAYERRSANIRNAPFLLIHPAFWSVLEISLD